MTKIRLFLCKIISVASLFWISESLALEELGTFDLNTSSDTYTCKMVTLSSLDAVDKQHILTVIQNMIPPALMVKDNPSGTLDCFNAKRDDYAAIIPGYFFNDWILYKGEEFIGRFALFYPNYEVSQADLRANGFSSEVQLIEIGCTIREDLRQTGIASILYPLLLEKLTHSPCTFGKWLLITSNKGDEAIQKFVTLMNFTFLGEAHGRSFEHGELTSKVAYVSPLNA